MVPAVAEEVLAVMGIPVWFAVYFCRKGKISMAAWNSMAWGFGSDDSARDTRFKPGSYVRRAASPDRSGRVSDAPEEAS